jgi:hypothetical protein
MKNKHLALALTGIFMAVGMAHAPGAAAAESACAAPDPKDELESSSAEDYFDRLEADAAACQLERMKGLAAAADKDTSRHVLSAMGSIIRKSWNITLVNKTMWEVAAVARRFPEQAAYAFDMITSYPCAHIASSSLFTRGNVLDTVGNIVANSKTPEVVEKGYQYFMSFTDDEKAVIREKAAYILFRMAMPHYPGMDTHRGEVVSLLDRMQDDPDPIASETAKIALEAIKAHEQMDAGLRRILERSTPALQPQ